MWHHFLRTVYADSYCSLPTSRGPGTLTHFYYPEQEWAKLLDIPRNCFSFRICTCRKPLWGSETFGSHRTHGLPSWYPAVGCQKSLVIDAPDCPHHSVHYMYEMTFTRCPTRTPVAPREPKIVEIKFFMIGHRKGQTCDRPFLLGRPIPRVQRQATTGHAGCRLEIVKIHWSRVPCLCKLQLHLLFPTRVLLQQNEPFQHARKRNEFFRCELRTFCGCQSYGCLIGLKTGNCARLSRLSHDIDSLKTGSEYRITPWCAGLTVPTLTVTGFGSSSSSRVIRNRGYMAGTRK